MTGERPIVDLVRVEAARLDRASDRTGGVDELRSSAVVEGERECHPPVAVRQLLGVCDLSSQTAGHSSTATADESHTDAALVEVVAPPDEEILVEVHEEAHLVDRSSPVLRGERVDRHPLEPDVEGTFDRVEQRLLAGGVSFGALEAALLGPTAVAVHHDGDVARDPAAVEGSRGHGSNLHRPLLARPPTGTIARHALDRGREPNRGSGPDPKAAPPAR